jgi:hypothetical protein
MSIFSLFHTDFRVWQMHYKNISFFCINHNQLLNFNLLYVSVIQKCVTEQKKGS